MNCITLKNLGFIHLSAKYRVWRYSNPNEVPVLKSPNGPELEQELERAKADEVSARRTIQDHLETCSVCIHLADREQGTSGAPAHALMV